MEVVPYENASDPFSSSSFLRYPIQISSNSGSERIEVEAVLDTGANALLIIPESYLLKLGNLLEGQPIRVVGIVPGEPKLMKTVILVIYIDGRGLKTSALVSPNIERPLLGVHLLETFNLSVVGGKLTLSFKSQNGR